MKPSARFIIILFSVYFLFSCTKKEKVKAIKIAERPLVKNQGGLVVFLDSLALKTFTTESVKSGNELAAFNSPARVVATVIKSSEDKLHNLILFDNPDVTANYTAFVQDLITINQYRTNLSRVKDLADHGAATGKEVIEAQSQLANQQAEIVEHEAQLKLAGFDPERLIKARANTVWMICDLPENQIGKIQKGDKCKIKFNSFPTEDYKGNVEDLGEIVDNATRMIKVRIGIENPGNKLKAGMFGSVEFDLKTGDFISVSKNSLIVVQGKSYVFIKKSVNEFERRELTIGQQINDRIIVFSGLHPGEEVVVTGVMQLKGLSFGY